MVGRDHAAVGDAADPANAKGADRVRCAGRSSPRAPSSPTRCCCCKRSDQDDGSLALDAKRIGGSLLFAPPGRLTSNTGQTQREMRAVAECSPPVGLAAELVSLAGLILFYPSALQFGSGSSDDTARLCLGRCGALRDN